MMSFLHVFIVIVFGLVFITTLLAEPTQPYSSAGWWYNTIWSLLAIGMGGWCALYTDTFISRNKSAFEKFHNKTRFPLFKKQAEGMTKPYMHSFCRALGILFILIGATLLLKNFGIL